MPEERDAELATALRQAKQQPMMFAFVAKGSNDGVLMVSKKKIPNKEINKAKADSGGKKVFRGRCQFEDGQIVFEMGTEPPSALAKQLKAVIHKSAGVVLQVDTRMANDLVEEEEGNESESGEIPEAPPLPGAKAPPQQGGQVPPPAPPPPPPPSQQQAPPTAPPPPPADPAAARFSARLQALEPIMKRIEGFKTQAAKDARLALSEAKTLFRGNDFANANETLDVVEGLIKEALAAGANGAVPPAPPTPNQQKQQDPGAVRFASRLKALAPIMPKAEATGSDFARQAKFQIGEANKLYAATKYNEANVALDRAEGLIKQAFAGMAKPNQGYEAALTGYQSARTQAVGRLGDLAKELGAEPHEEAAKAQLEVRAVIAQLTEAPASAQQIAALQSYLLKDDVVFDVCELAYDFRTPMMKSLDALKASFAS